MPIIIVCFQRMAATEREMAARGMVLNNNMPQLLVNFMPSLQRLRFKLSAGLFLAR